jgi:regulator of replication initiation timing
MHELEDQVKRINEKLLQLLKQFGQLQKEYERLKKEKQDLTDQLSQLGLESETWKRQTEILKMSKGEMNEEEKKAFEKRLAQYVKEIDRCIALLSE